MFVNSSPSASKPPVRAASPAPGAVIYAEGHFARPDGKTANGLIRHSAKYRVVGVIDSTLAGLDAGQVLDGVAVGIPICRDLDTALAGPGERPEYFIFGMAPTSGMLSLVERGVVLRAIGAGLHIVNGLHEFLNDDNEFVTASVATGVTLIDIRKPPGSKDLHAFTGAISRVGCPRIAVMGTDCAIGKRTTATILTRVLNDAGIRTVMITTGQTGLMQGARFGVALDAIPSQFCAGELESVVVAAYDTLDPEVIVIEGQGALSHPAFCTSAFILRGSNPDAVILQHAPGRRHRCDFPQLPMPSVVGEINLIETFSDTRVIGITINHEHMNDDAVQAMMTMYRRQLRLPVTDVLTQPDDELLAMVTHAFPMLGRSQEALVS